MRYDGHPLHQGLGFQGLVDLNETLLDYLRVTDSPVENMVATTIPRQQLSAPLGGCRAHSQLAQSSARHQPSIRGFFWLWVMSAGYCADNSCGARYLKL